MLGRDTQAFSFDAVGAGGWGLAAYRAAAMQFNANLTV